MNIGNISYKFIRYSIQFYTHKLTMRKKKYNRALKKIAKFYLRLSGVSDEECDDKDKVSM